MLIVLASARATPGRRVELVALAQAVTAATRGDDGCEAYGFYTDLLDEDTIVSVEVWRDQAALDAHLAHDHTREFLMAVPGLVDGDPTVVVHPVLDPH